LRVGSVTYFTAAEVFHVTESLERWHGVILKACRVWLVRIFSVEISKSYVSMERE
jgi:hypothetical protein